MITPSTDPAPSPVSLQPRVPVWRFATAEDDPFVEELQALAFGPGRFARTAFRVRERFPIDPTLSLIAEVDGTRSGSVWMTPISIGGIDGYMLGPLATHPQYRKLGAGKMLAREVTRIALARGTGQFVLLIGDQDYYCPLGWQKTAPGAIEWPGPVDPARVLLYCPDPALVPRIHGEIEAFGQGQA